MTRLQSMQGLDKHKRILQGYYAHATVHHAQPPVPVLCMWTRVRASNEGQVLMAGSDRYLMRSGDVLEEKGRSSSS